jgi:hypothetical protein
MKIYFHESTLRSKTKCFEIQHFKFIDYARNNKENFFLDRLPTINQKQSYTSFPFIMLFQYKYGNYWQLPTNCRTSNSKFRLSI